MKGVDATSGMTTSYGARVSRRRTVLQRLAALSAGGAALIGCAGPNAAGEERPAASAAPVTVRYVNDVGTPTADAFNEEIIKQVTQKYNGKIVLQVEPFPDPDWAKRYEKYTAMSLANVLPEVIWLCCQFIRPFMIAGLSANLDPYIKKDWKPADIDDFYKPQYEAFKIEGKQLGIPAYVNVNIMFVNRNLLKQAGLAFPADDWTKAQVQDYAIKLTNKSAGVWGFDMSFLGADRNCTWIYNNGGEPHDPKDGPVVTKLTYDAPKTVEGLQFLHDQLWKHQVSPKNNDDRGGLTRDDAFLAGKIAMVMDAASSSGGTYFNKAPAAGLDWDFMPLPKGPGGYGGRISTDGYMIDKNTKLGDQAWTVLKELTSAETSVIRGTVQRQQPPRRSAISSFEKGFEGKTARLSKLMGETGRADPRAFWKDAVQVEALLRKGFDASLGRNEVPLAAAMTSAMQEIRGYYGN
jgi:ABC-type glycerol-3-phosphate transport system substrate-binding protein